MAFTWRLSTGRMISCGFVDILRQWKSSRWIRWFLFYVAEASHGARRFTNGCQNETGKRFGGNVRICIDKHTAREIIKFLEKAFIFERKRMKEDLQRCNHCMEVFDESLTECPNCGLDDALMHPFESYSEKE